MARYGMTYGSGYGAPDNFVQYIRLTPASGNTSVFVAFMPATGYGNSYFQILNNSIKMADVYAGEGVETVVRVPQNYGQNQCSIAVLRLGHAMDDGINLQAVARTYEVDSKRIVLTWTWTPKMANSALDDLGYTSNWTLTGVKRTNTSRVFGHFTWGELRIDLAVSGGVATVTVRNGGMTVASGSGAVGTTVTLSAQNSSGLSGTVDVSAGAVTVDNAYMEWRWPAWMRIRRDTVDPPVVDLSPDIKFDGFDQGKFMEPSDLAAGTYYYRLIPLSDTGVLGTASATLSATVLGAPEAPTNLTYSSGNAAATVLSFTPSATVGATYNLYMAQPGAAPMNLNDVVATAGVGATTITMPAVVGYPGTVQVLLRSTKTGVEEKNVLCLNLTYDAGGNYVAPAPNVPEIVVSSIAFSAGLAMTLNANYMTGGELAAGTKVRLYQRVPGGSYGAYVDEQTLTATSTGLKHAALSYTFGAAGFYWIAVKAITAAGTLSAISTEVLVFASAELMPAATGNEIMLARA